MPAGTKAPVQIAFGKAVRRVRKTKKISQEKLAALAGINRGYMGSVERGERNLALQNMEKIARALGVKLSQIIRVMEEERRRVRPPQGASGQGGLTKR
jgi:transcriptional regulator with XRE-family HTH domain